MIFELLSNKNKSIDLIINISIVVLFAISGILCSYFDSVLPKIFVALIVLYWLSPITLVKKKYIGTFELSDDFICIKTQDNVCIYIPLNEISYCKLDYCGYKGNINFLARGWYFDSGINEFEIISNKGNFKVQFISQSENDNNQFIEYIDVLKRWNIAYCFKMADYTYKSLDDIPPSSS